MMRQRRRHESLFLLSSVTLLCAGMYMVEDMETSYNREYGGGFSAASSFAEYTKPMVRCRLPSFHASADARATIVSLLNLAGQHT